MQRGKGRWKCVPVPTCLFQTHVTSAPRFRPDALARVEDAALRPAGSWEQLTRILLVRYAGRGGGAPRTNDALRGLESLAVSRPHARPRRPAPPARPSRQRRSSHSGPGHPSPPDRKPRRGGSRSLQIISDGVFSQCSDPASTLSQQRQREGACSATAPFPAGSDPRDSPRRRVIIPALQRTGLARPK